MTNLNRYKPVGWRGESHRHYLASKGIMSSGGDIMQKSNMLGRMFDLKTSYDDGEKIVPGIGKAGGEVLPRAFKAGENEEFVPDAEHEGQRYTEGAYHGAVEYAAEKGDEPEQIGEDEEEETTYFAAKDVGSYMAKEDMVSFSPEQARAFKKRYEEAQANGEEQFTWEGKPVLTSYAKYMVEYMKMRGYDAEKTPYAHVPNVHTPKQVHDFEERTGRRHEGESLVSYWKRAATEDVPDRDVTL